MGLLTYNLKRWQRVRKTGIGIASLGFAGVTAVLLSVESWNWTHLAIGTRLGSILVFVLILVGISLISVAQTKLRKINQEISRTGDP